MVVAGYDVRRAASNKTEPGQTGDVVSLDDARRLLGVSPDAGVEDVRAARRRLAKRCHPDVAGGDTETMRQLNEAASIVLHELGVVTEDTEPPIDLTRPILDQRGWWFENFAYSKPILATVKMHWYDGFHARRDGRANFDYDLRLIHLHRMDFNLCLKRHRFRSNVTWSDKDIVSSYGYQNRIIEENRFAEWFYADSCTHLPIKQKKIPEVWRSLRI